MTEKIAINGKDAWIVVEPHTLHLPGAEPTEYFTASYYLADPAVTPAGILFTDKDQKAISFNSPVQALEYASEQLLAMKPVA
ncbi:MAG TPA: hypothetical protein VL307_07645 [Chitinophagaceae bacterium]|nr:hypothetical protein [Chitinophagaceae bacterium]